MGNQQERCNFIVLPRVDSTNTYAKDNFFSLDDCTVIAAVEQFAGRGRLGRSWISTPDASLTVSVIFKKIIQPFHAGIILGLAGLELVREYLPETFVFFKWPNDIYIRDCKIAGILSEGVLSSGKLAGVVSGIGINVNQSAEELAKFDNPAASFKSVSGEKFFLEKLRFELAEKIKKYYIIYQSDSAAVIELWHQENRLIGETLVLKCPDGTVKQGIFAAISESGEMILRSGANEVFTFDCGDVKIDSSLIDFYLLENKHKAK